MTELLSKFGDSVAATQEKKPITNKERYSQFYTVGNPFVYAPFQKWLSAIPQEDKQILLEPFAGANHIVGHLKSFKWDCYDIDPKATGVIARDTLKDFPEGYGTCITNPPYIAKNAAKRNGIPYPDTKYDDLYKLSLDRMLANCRWVAAIIPESFLTAELFQERLQAVISIPDKLFEDTDHPTCVALFGPDTTKGFEIWSGNTLLGEHSDLLKVIPAASNERFVFNDPKGEMAIICIDNTKGPTISFVDPDRVPASLIKHSSRSKTRVSSPLFNNPVDTQRVMKRANEILAHIREETKDVFLTSFKGLREDGRYRRRLDFILARKILSQAVREVLVSSPKTVKKPKGKSPQQGIRDFQLDLPLAG